jgi:hypothetical protein
MLVCNATTRRWESPGLDQYLAIPRFQEAIAVEDYVGFSVTFDITDQRLDTSASTGLLRRRTACVVKANGPLSLSCRHRDGRDDQSASASTLRLHVKSPLARQNERPQFTTYGCCLSMAHGRSDHEVRARFGLIDQDEAPHNTSIDGFIPGR